MCSAGKSRSLGPCSEGSWLTKFRREWSGEGGVDTRSGSGLWSSVSQRGASRRKLHVASDQCILDCSPGTVMHKVPHEMMRQQLRAYEHSNTSGQA